MSSSGGSRAYEVDSDVREFSTSWQPFLNDAPVKYIWKRELQKGNQDGKRFQGEEAN
jgi:hypothetical protein